MAFEDPRAFERRRLREIYKEKQELGETRYLISSKWFNLFAEYTKVLIDGVVDYSDNGPGRPGPIDNSMLSAETESQIDPSMGEEVDFYILPEGAYKLLVEWYGGGPEFPRTVISRGLTGALFVEIFPLVFNVYPGKSDGDPDMDYKEVMYLSRSTTIDDALVAASKRFAMEAGNCRLLFKYDIDPDWRVMDPTNCRVLADEVEGSTSAIELLVEQKVVQPDGGLGDFPRVIKGNAWRYALKKGDIIDGKDGEGKWYESIVRSLSTEPGEHTPDTNVQVQFRGWSSKWNLTYKLTAPELAPLHTHVRNWRDLSLYDPVEALVGEKWHMTKVVGIDAAGQRVELKFVQLETPNIWVSTESDDICEQYTHCKKPAATAVLALPATSVTTSTSGYTGATGTYGKTYSSTYSNTRSTGYGDYDSYGYGSRNRSHVAGTPIAPGAVGLYNLGNTCFMNSMLQCLSNTEPLTTHLLRDEALEINFDNPLGTGGKMVEAYADLLKSMWSGKVTTCVPETLKRVIGQFAPQFAGYNQHDSQELMNFLLDGLHEDTNRVKKKPYTESVESGGRPDAVVAAEAWQRHQLRNNSFVVDLIQGQLKSHVTCPDCGESSVTFDPYMSLSLPLPASNTRTLRVVLVRADPARLPVRMSVKVPKNGVGSDIFAAVAAVVNAGGTEPALASGSLRVADVYNGVIYSLFANSRAVADIRPKDEVYVYELAQLPASSALDAAALPNREAGQMDVDTSTDAPASAPAMAVAHPALMHVVERMSAPAYSGGAATLRRDPILLPLVLSISVDWSCARLAAYLAGLLAPMLRVEPEGGLPYRLRLADARGYNCVLCGSSLSSYGRPACSCELPADAGRSVREMLASCINPNAANYGSYNYGVRSSTGVSANNVCVVVEWLDEARLSTEYAASVNTAIARPKVANWADDEEEGETGGAIQLETCFDKFVEREQLGEEDPWYCPRCKDHKRAFKKFDLWSTPEVLVLHLKRFQYAQGQFAVHRDKINTLVQFPLEGLDLRRYVRSSDAVVTNTDAGGGAGAGTSAGSGTAAGSSMAQPEPIYDLYAVSEHSGSLGGGHYTAVARNFRDQRWYAFNDSSVHPTDASAGVTRQAYVLFYRRRRHGDGAVTPSNN